MKFLYNLLPVAALVFFAACGGPEVEEAPAVDTTTVMESPAVIDTTMMMDTTAVDTTAQM